MAGIAQQDVDARIEKRQLAVTMLELVEIEFGDILECLGRGYERYPRAVFRLAIDDRRIAGDLERCHRIAISKAHLMLLAVTPYD